MTDVAADPAHAATLNRMLALLQETQRAFGDDLPLSVDDPQPKAFPRSEQPRVPDAFQPQWIREKYFEGAS